MTLPEVGDRAKIWRVVRHDHHEIDPLGAGLRYPPRGIKTRAIGIEQQGRHHARIERRLTKPAFVACDDLRQIQVLARQSDDEVRQMVRRHIIDERRWQKLCLINCPRTKMSVMPQRESDSSRKCHHDSDTLLASEFWRKTAQHGGVAGHADTPDSGRDGLESDCAGDFATRSVTSRLLKHNITRGQIGDALSVLGRGHPAHRDRSFFILGVCGGRFGSWRRRTTALRE